MVGQKQTRASVSYERRLVAGFSVDIFSQKVSVPQMSAPFLDEMQSNPEVGKAVAFPIGSFAHVIPVSAL